MKFSILFFALVSPFVSQAFAEPSSFLPLTKENLLKNWGRKSNTRLEEHAGGAVAISIQTNEFFHGWMQRAVKASDLPGKASGVYGRFLAPKGMTGTFRVTFICLPDKDYFTAQGGRLSDSENVWTEFYLPLSSFSCVRGTPKNSLSRRGVQAGDTLEIGINEPLPGVPVCFDSLRLVGTNEEQSVARPVRRHTLQRDLLPEDRTAPRHPRLLLTTGRLARVRQKVQTLPESKAVYDAFIKEADRLLAAYPKNRPEDPILKFEAHGETNRHQWSAQLEGAVTRAVVPLETLAAAYRLTGDERYGRRAARGLVSLARAVDSDTPMLNQGFYYTRTFYVRALALGYDWLWPLFTAEERLDIKITLLGFVQDIHDAGWAMAWGDRPLRRVWNWNPGLVSSAGLGMLALEGETRLGEKAILFDFRRYLRDYLTQGIDSDGSGHEGPSYLAYGIGAGPQFAECLREQGRGDLFEDTNLKLIAPWLVSEILPDGRRWNNLQDCDYGVNPAPVYSYVCGRLAALARPGGIASTRCADPEPLDAPKDFLWQYSEHPGDRAMDDTASAALMGWAWKCIGRNIAKSSAPNQLAYLLFYEPCPIAENPARILPDLMHFRGRGLVVARTGYGPDDAYLAVEAGPYVAGHNQSDKSSFTFYAYGGDLAIDSGYGNDSDSAKSTSSGAHNMVLINGAGQPMRGHNMSNGHITGLRHEASHDWIRVEAAEAWNCRLSGETLQPLPNPVQIQRAIRQFCFVRPSGDIPPYLVVYDDIRKDNAPADYTWLWHIPSSMAFSFGKDRWTAKPLDISAESVLTTPRENANGSAQFVFTAPAEGSYSLLGLVAATGAEVGKSDSFFVDVKGKSFLWPFGVSDACSHWISVMDSNCTIPSFGLKKGEKLEVGIRVREPEAALVKLALIPAGTGTPPVALGERIKGGIVLTAADALSLQGTLRRKPFTSCHSDARLTVFPVASDATAVSASWFLTTTQGLHPRLEHTVRAVNPHFLMVLVPGREGTPLPQARRSGEHGVTLRWPNATDTIVFTDKAVSFSRK